MNKFNVKSLFKPRLAFQATAKALGKYCKLSKANFSEKREEKMEEMRGLDRRLSGTKARQADTERTIKQLRRQLDKISLQEKRIVGSPQQYAVDEVRRIKKLPITQLKVTRPLSKDPSKKVIVPPQILAVTDILYTEKARDDCYEYKAEKEMGRYAIILDLAQKTFSNQIKAINLTQRARKLYDHPCIKNPLESNYSSICFGNILNRVKKAWKELRFFDVFDLVIDLICSPRSGGFIGWSGWFDEAKKPTNREIKQLMKQILTQPITKTITKPTLITLINGSEEDGPTEVQAPPRPEITLNHFRATTTGW